MRSEKDVVTYQLFLQEQLAVRPYAAATNFLSLDSTLYSTRIGETVLKLPTGGQWRTMLRREFDGNNDFAVINIPSWSEVELCLRMQVRLK